MGLSAAAAALPNISIPVTGSQGASSNSAKSISNNNSTGYSWTKSNTYGQRATAASKEFADAANQAAYDAWKAAADYNSREAMIQRNWQEEMASTLYQRSVRDMIAAGINPILAAGNGLGSASVGSGAAASMSPASTFMANAYPETISSGESANQSTGHSESNSQGSSWQEAGLATALKQMGDMIGQWINTKNTAQSIDINLSGLKGEYYDIGDNLKAKMIDILGPNVSQKLGLTKPNKKGTGGHTGGGHKF